MHNLRYAMAASVAACLFGGIAAAQDAPPAPPATSAAPDTSQSQPVVAPAPAAPAAIDAATQASAATTEPTNALVTVTIDANGVRHMLITSPPVPDTPENRARYGRPLSRAGERTEAAGN